MGTLVIENIVAGYGSGPNILRGLSLIVESGKILNRFKQQMVASS